MLYSFDADNASSAVAKELLEEVARYGTPAAKHVLAGFSAGAQVDTAVAVQRLVTSAVGAAVQERRELTAALDLLVVIDNARRQGRSTGRLRQTADLLA